MKKLIAIALALALLLSLTGCDALNSEKKDVVKNLVDGDWTIALGQSGGSYGYIFADDGTCVVESVFALPGGNQTLKDDATYEVNTEDDTILIFQNSTTTPSMIFRYTLEGGNFSMEVALDLLLTYSSDSQ